jgi:phosphatidylserine decarboxylase
MAPYARMEITLILLLGGIITAVTGYYLHWWALLPGILALALLLFYRDPPRRIPPGDDLLLAPADGRIMSVEHEYHADESAAPQLRIVIFLSVLNVHINRSPCAGRVTDVKYSPGKFLNALKPEATLVNENNLLTLEPPSPLSGPVHVRQIAGVLAKRVVCTATVGDTLAAGQRFGMIKLGSQTELCVPADPRWEVTASAGDHVKAGATILARFSSD